jgi:hypothetical protein
MRDEWWVVRVRALVQYQCTYFYVQPIKFMIFSWTLKVTTSSCAGLSALSIKVDNIGWAAVGWGV